MKKITQEDAKNLKVRPEGRTSYARAVLMNMNVGEVIILERGDWKQKKKKPRTYCLHLGRNTGRQWNCATLMDGTGWVIERMK